MVSIKGHVTHLPNPKSETNLSQNIHITAWGPLTISRGTQNVSSSLTAQRIAQELGITAAQLCLSWAVQRGTSVVPKSTHEDRLRENLEGMFCECADVVVVIKYWNWGNSGWAFLRNYETNGGTWDIGSSGANKIGWEYDVREAVVK